MSRLDAKPAIDLFASCVSQVWSCDLLSAWLSSIRCQRRNADKDSHEAVRTRVKSKQKKKRNENKQEEMNKSKTEKLVRADLMPEAGRSLHYRRAGWRLFHIFCPLPSPWSSSPPRPVLIVKNLTRKHYYYIHLVFPLFYLLRSFRPRLPSFCFSFLRPVCALVGHHSSFSFVCIPSGRQCYCTVAHSLLIDD